MTTPRLAMAEITESQASKYATHNDALRVIDGLLQAIAQDYTATPPGSPTDGQCWLVGASATGAWASQDQKIAQYYDSAWSFHSPAAGWRAYNAAAGCVFRYTGSAWEADKQVRKAISMASDANKTLTTAEAAGDILDITSGVSLTATRNIVLPLTAQQWTVYNGTTGAQSLQFIGATGTGITVANGKRAILYADGTNIVRVTADNP